MKPQDLKWRNKFKGDEHDESGNKEEGDQSRSEKVWAGLRLSVFLYLSRAQPRKMVSPTHSDYDYSSSYFIRDFPRQMESPLWLEIPQFLGN